MRALDGKYWRSFFLRLYEVTVESDIFGRAAQSAFYLSFALFPLIYFLISLFGLLLVSTDGLKAETYSYLNRIMPATAFELVRRTMEEIIANSSGGKLTVGLIATLWSASAGIDGIRSALNSIYGLKDRRSWWRNKIQSLVLTLLVTLLAGLLLTIIFYGWQLVQMGMARMNIPVPSSFVLVAVQWFSIVLVMLFCCEVIYNLLPDFRRFYWRWITPGSVVAIVLWLILTTGLRTYISFFNSYDRTYGSLGAVIILLLWLYLTALVIMIGGAINTVGLELTTGREKPDPCEAAANG
jgi:membrane protein